MRDISSIFEYFKKAFHLNKSNKNLYYPQIAFILLKASMFVIFGVLLYQLVMEVSGGHFNEFDLAHHVKAMLWWGLSLLVILGLGSIIMEAGLYNMYKHVLSGKTVDMSTFTDGVQTYFFKILFATLLMLLMWLVILVPYLIIGLITLFTGFFFIPVVIGIFTAMWKVSIVMDDLTVLEGLRKGFTFAKENFKPLAALVIIKSAFLSAGGGSGNSGSNTGGNMNNSFNSNNTMTENIDIPDMSSGIDSGSFEEAMSQALPFIKTGFYILVPLVTVAIIVGALIKMIFEIFFNLSIFVMYDHTEKNMISEEDAKLKSDPLAAFDMEVE